MNICFFSFRHISKTKSGVDRVTDILSTSLRKRGHFVYMISVCAPVSNDELTETQYYLPCLDTKSEQNITFLKNFYTTKKIDIIINQAEERRLFDLIYDTHSNIPIISCIHCDPMGALKGITDQWDERKLKLGWKFYLHYPLYPVRRIYQYYNRRKYISCKYRIYYDKCDAIVLLSEKIKSSFLGLIQTENKDKLYAINNPCPFLADSSTLQAKEKIVLFVGRLDFQKRVDRLLRIWKAAHTKKQEWKLQIIGDGTHKSLYETICNKLELSNVEFLGKRNPEEYYQKASILCMTSSHEGLPMVMLEALQYEVIPVAFNSFESISDIITDKNTGFIVDKFSEDEYSKILTLLMNNEEYRLKIQKNISEVNKTTAFNIEKIIDKWEDLFKCLKVAQ